MKKLVVAIIIFMAGHLYGNVVINAAKSVYRVTVNEIQNARR